VDTGCAEDPERHAEHRVTLGEPRLTEEPEERSEQAGDGGGPCDKQRLK
jgi:hypothetical protein